VISVLSGHIAVHSKQSQIIICTFCSSLVRVHPMDISVIVLKNNITRICYGIVVKCRRFNVSLQPSLVKLRCIHRSYFKADNLLRNMSLPHSKKSEFREELIHYFTSITILLQLRLFQPYISRKYSSIEPEMKYKLVELSSEQIFLCKK
jgi:hypothetical protein